MGKEKLQNILIYFFVAVSIALITIVWDKILIPYDNPRNIIGVLQEANFHPSNNSLRYIIFISTPITIFLIGKYLCDKNIILKFKWRQG